jgi:hypothetical protein
MKSERKKYTYIFKYVKTYGGAHFKKSEVKKKKERVK